MNCFIHDFVEHRTSSQDNGFIEIKNEKTGLIINYKENKCQ